MTTALIRSNLAPLLAPLGFSRRGSNFVLRQPELEHVISVLTVRRLAGYFEILHSVHDAAGSLRQEVGQAPLIQDRVQGFAEPYLSLWAADRLNPELAAKQVSAIVKAFASLADVAHFYSDREVPHGTPTAQPLTSSIAPASLSKVEEEELLRTHSNSVFDSQFTPVPRLGKGMWAHRREVGGFRYCAYLAATDTATFASIIYFAFSSPDIEKGRKSEAVLRNLFGAPKHLLTYAGQPVLIPLTESDLEPEWVSNVLDRALAESAPNKIPRREA